MFRVWNTSYCTRIFCIHNMLHCLCLKILITWEATTPYPRPIMFSSRNASHLHTSCYSVHNLYPVHPSDTIMPARHYCLFSSTVSALLPAGALDRCAHLESAEKHPPLLYTDNFMTRGGEIPSLLTTTILLTIPYPQGAFSPTHVPSQLLLASLLMPLSQVASPTAHLRPSSGLGPRPHYLVSPLDIV